MSHESTAANILKGVGTAAGYVILTVATAGAGGAVAAASTAISAGAAAVGGIGSGTQNALKQAQLANPEMSAGDAFNSAFGQGVKQGAIAAGTTLLTAGIAKGLQIMSGGGQFATLADKIDDATRLGKVAHGAQDLINKELMLSTELQLVEKLLMVPEKFLQEQEVQLMTLLLQLVQNKLELI
jgi:hypothetical protein